MIGIYGNKTDYIVSALVIMGGGRTILFICFAMFPVSDFYVSPVLSDVRFFLRFFCVCSLFPYSPIHKGFKIQLINVLECCALSSTRQNPEVFP